MQLVFHFDNGCVVLSLLHRTVWANAGIELFLLVLRNRFDSQLRSCRGESIVPLSNYVLLGMHDILWMVESCPILSRSLSFMPSSVHHEPCDTIVAHLRLLDMIPCVSHIVWNGKNIKSNVVCLPLLFCPFPAKSASTLHNPLRTVRQTRWALMIWERSRTSRSIPRFHYCESCPSILSPSLPVFGCW